MKTILVIEDHTPMRTNLTELLELNGYKVIPASDGKTAIELVNTEKPDLILCDILLPQMNGYEVFSTFRQNKYTARIPFVFMTGDTFFEQNRGHHYLTKPFDPKKLLETISSKLEDNTTGSDPKNLKHEHVEALEYILNSISHEMRNPICSSLGLASLLELQAGRRNQKETKKIIDGIKANAIRLNEITGIITNVLHVAIHNYRNMTNTP